MTGIESNKRRIIVEGLIGAGKSTLIKEFKEKMKDSYNITVFKEPVSHDLMEDFYREIRNTLEVQRHFYKNLMEIYASSVIDGDVYVLDRSIIGSLAFTMKFVFSGPLNTKDFNMEINNMEMTMLYETSRDRDFVYFLDIGIEESLERIKKRGIQYEQGIPISYIQDLYRAYVFMLAYLIHNKIPVVIINAEDPIEQQIEDIDYYANASNKNVYCYDENVLDYVMRIQEDLDICFTRLPLVEIIYIMRRYYDRIWSFEVAQDAMTFIRDNLSIKRN